MKRSWSAVTATSFVCAVALLALSCQGGTGVSEDFQRLRWTLEPDPDYPADHPDDLLDESADVLQRRLKEFGIDDALVERQGSSVVVEMDVRKGIDSNRVVSLLGLRGWLGLHLVKTPEESSAVVDRVQQALQRHRGLVDSTGTGATMLPLRLDDSILKTWGGFAFEEAEASSYATLMESLAADSLLPPHTLLAVSRSSFEFEPGRPVRLLFVLDRLESVKGSDIEDAEPRSGLDSTQPSQMGILGVFNKAGTEAFRRATTANVGRHLAIVVDDEVVSAPLIREPVADGRFVLTSDFTKDEAFELALVLDTGYLPIRLQVAREEIIEPDQSQGQ